MVDRGGGVGAVRPGSGPIGSCLERVLGGRAQVVVLEGDKDRTAQLVDEFVVDLVDPDLVVASISGSVEEAGLRFGLADQVGRFIAPERRPTVDPSLSPEDVGRYFLHLLDTVLVDPLVLLVVEDAHWADEPSLRALAYALRRVRNSRLLTIITIHPGELGRLPQGLVRLTDGGGGAHVLLLPHEPVTTAGAVLTPTEQAIAVLVALGHSNTEIATERCISVKTVETHIRHLFDKVGVRNRTELAMRWSLVNGNGVRPAPVT